MLKEHPVLEKFSMDSKSYVVLKHIEIVRAFVRSEWVDERFF